MIPISGEFPQNGTIGGATTLYVTDTATPLPVQIDTSLGGANPTIAFSHWGEHLALTAPPNPVSDSSLSG